MYSFLALLRNLHTMKQKDKASERHPSGTVKFSNVPQQGAQTGVFCCEVSWQFDFFSL